MYDNRTTSRIAHLYCVASSESFNYYFQCPILFIGGRHEAQLRGTRQLSSPGTKARTVLIEEYTHQEAEWTIIEAGGSSTRRPCHLA